MPHSSSDEMVDPSFTPRRSKRIAARYASAEASVTSTQTATRSTRGGRARKSVGKSLPSVETAPSHTFGAGASGRMPYLKPAAIKPSNGFQAIFTASRMAAAANSAALRVGSAATAAVDDGAGADSNQQPPAPALVDNPLHNDKVLLFPDDWLPPPVPAPTKRAVPSASSRASSVPQQEPPQQPSSPPSPPPPPPPPPPQVSKPSRIAVSSRATPPTTTPLTRSSVLRESPAHSETQIDLTMVDDSSLHSESDGAYMLEDDERVIPSAPAAPDVSIPNIGSTSGLPSDRQDRPSPVPSRASARMSVGSHSGRRLSGQPRSSGPLRSPPSGPPSGFFGKLGRFFCGIFHGFTSLSTKYTLNWECLSYLFMVLPTVLVLYHYFTRQGGLSGGSSPSAGSIHPFRLSQSAIFPSLHVPVDSSDTDVRDAIRKVFEHPLNLPVQVLFYRNLSSGEWIPDPEFQETLNARIQGMEVPNGDTDCSFDVWAEYLRLQGDKRDKKITTSSGIRLGPSVLKKCEKKFKGITQNFAIALYSTEEFMLSNFDQLIAKRGLVRREEMEKMLKQYAASHSPSSYYTDGLDVVKQKPNFLGGSCERPATIIRELTTYNLPEAAVVNIMDDISLTNGANSPVSEIRYSRDLLCAPPNPNPDGRGSGQIGFQPGQPFYIDEIGYFGLSDGGMTFKQGTQPLELELWINTAGDKARNTISKLYDSRHSKDPCTTDSIQGRPDMVCIFKFLYNPRGPDFQTFKIPLAEDLHSGGHSVNTAVIRVTNTWRSNQSCLSNFWATGTPVDPFPPSGRE